MNNNLAIIYFLDFENLPSAPDCWHSWQTSRYINYILQALAVCAYLLLSSFIKKWNTFLPGAVKVGGTRRCHAEAVTYTHLPHHQVLYTTKSPLVRKPTYGI